MLSAEKPAENEFPSKPFGYLIDKTGLSDDQSIAGSINLRINDNSSVATSRTSEAGSQPDLRYFNPFCCGAPRNELLSQQQFAHLKCSKSSAKRMKQND